MMLNRYFNYMVLCCLLVVFCPSYAHAQQCDVNYETLTKLHHPDPGSYTVWDSLFGAHDINAEFVSAVNYDDGGVLAVGEEQRLDNNSATIMFVHFDHRGRKVWDKYHNIRGLSNIVKMLPNGDGYVVLAHYKKAGQKQSLWLGFFDHEGSFKSQKIIKSAEFNLTASDIIPAIGENGWRVSVVQERHFGGSKSGISRKNAAMYLLDKKGNAITRRAYMLGANNEIIGLSENKFEDGKVGYIATGYFESPVGKKIGWVLRLREDLSLVWQREFGRGLSAKLKLSADYNDDYMLVFGDVKPSDTGTVGNWLMLLDKNSGKTLWQRYYYGASSHHDYAAGGLYVSDDGLITLMMMARSIMDAPVEAQPQEDGGVVVSRIVPEYMDYAHILTLSPRGVMISGDSYYYGQGISLSQLVEGEDGSRIMVGYSSVFEKMDFEEKNIAKSGVSPLKEAGHINLPDASLSVKAKEGLALLKGDGHGRVANVHHAGDEIAPVVVNHAEESAKSTIKKAWLVIGDMPDDYEDPCVRVKR